MLEFFQIGEVDFGGLCEVLFILVTFYLSHRWLKKHPDREDRYRLCYYTLGGTLGLMAPFALLQTLSVCGVHIFDANWGALCTPLNIFVVACIDFYVVASNGKLFGTLDTTKVPDGTK